MFDVGPCNQRSHAIDASGAILSILPMRIVTTPANNIFCGRPTHCLHSSATTNLQQLKRPKAQSAESSNLPHTISTKEKYHVVIPHVTPF